MGFTVGVGVGNLLGIEVVGENVGATAAPFIALPNLTNI